MPNSLVENEVVCAGKECCQVGTEKIPFHVPVETETGEYGILIVEIEFCETCAAREIMDVKEYYASSK